MSGNVANLQRDGLPIVPFERGNRHALRTGQYATKAHSPDVAALVEEWRDLMPVFIPAFEPLLQTAALLFCRVISAEAHGDELTPLAKRDLNTQRAELRRQLAELGMTPMAAGRLGLDLSRTDALAAIRLRDLDGAGARAEARHSDA